MSENIKDSVEASEIVRSSILIPFQEKLLFRDVQNQLTLDKWEQVKCHVHLSTGMTEVAYRTWIEPLEMKQISGWAIDVYYPGDNEWAAEYIMTHYRLAIQLAIHDVLGSDVYVEIKNKKAKVINTGKYPEGISDKEKKKIDNIIKIYKGRK